MPGRRELARLCGLGAEGAGWLAGWGQIFVKPRHEKHDLPPGDATDDTAMLLGGSAQASGLLLLHILQSRLPTSSFLCCSSQIPILKLLRPWPALPAHQLQMPAFVGWRHQTGLAPAQSPCWWCGESWWWSKLVPQNGSTECHTPSPLLHRTRPTVNMAPAVAKCQNLMSQKVRFLCQTAKNSSIHISGAELHSLTLVGILGVATSVLGNCRRPRMSDKIFDRPAGRKYHNPGRHLLPARSF